MQTNIRSTLATAVFLTSVVLSGCSDKTPTEFIDAAKIDLNSGNSSSAIINLKNVLRVEATNIEARYLLGKAYLIEGKWVNAEKEFSKALELGFVGGEIHTSLAKSLYYASDLAGLEELSRLTLAKQKQEVVDFYYAAEKIKQGLYEEGLEIMKLLVAQGLDTKYSKLSTIWLAANVENVEKIKGLINDLRSKEPSFSDAMLFNARFSYKLNEMDTAANEFQSFLQLHPNAHEIRLMYVRSLARNSQFDEADTQANLLLKISPNSPLLNEIKGQVAFTNKDYRQAKTFAEKSLNSNPSAIISSIVAGVSAYYLDELESSYLHLSKVEQRLSFKHPAKQILSAVKLKLGRYDEVYESFSGAELDELDPELISLTANEFFKLGKVDEADDLLALGEKVNDPTGQLSFQRGFGKLLAKDDNALNFFEKALKADNNNENAAILLILEHIRLKNHDKAFQVAKSIAIDFPAMSLTLEGAVYRAQRNLPQAREAFLRAIKLDDENLPALYYLAEIHEVEKDFKLAINNYMKVVTLNVNPQKALFALLRLSKHKEFNAEISEFLKKKAAKTNNEDIIMILAEVYIKEPNIEAAISLLEEKVDKMPTNVKLFDHLAKVYLQAGNHDKAILITDKLTKLDADPTKIYLSKAFIYERAKQNSDAIAILRDGLKHLTKNEYLLTRLIDILIKDKNIVDAKKELMILKEVAEESHTYALYSGKISFIEGDDFQAVKLLTKAYMQQSDFKTLADLSQALQNTNNNSEAINLLSESFDNNGARFPLNLRLKLAEIYTDQQPDKAILIYRDLLVKTNAHFIILNNIALVYSNEGNYIQAEEYARKALLKSDNNPAVANTLGLILQRKGNIKEAIEYLDLAYVKSNKKADFALHFSEALYENNNRNKAKNVFDKILLNDISNKYKTRHSELSAQLKGEK